MALEYYTPGVYVEEVSSGFKPITGVPTSVVGFIGEAKEGPVNEPVLVTNWASYFDKFIGYSVKDKLNPRGGVEKDALGNPIKERVPNQKSTDLDWAMYAFFSNGGSKAYVVSVGSGKNGVVTQPATTQPSSKDEKKDGKKDEKKAQPAVSAKGFDLVNAIIGNDGGPSRRSGIHCFKEVDEIALLVAPGVTDKAVQQEILSFCETFNIFAILDAPKSLDELSDYGLSRDLNGLAGLSAKCASKQAAIYFPWVKTYDPESKSTISVAPSGFVAGIYARTDSQRGVHKAPANEVVRLATDLEYNISDAEQESLNQNGINCIRNFSDSGIRVWGARTTISASDPEWRYVNVRRLFNMIEKSLQVGTKWAVFEPNDIFLWKKLKRNVTAFLTRVYNSGALAGANADEAFFVRCDESTNPQESVDAGIVTIEVGIAPVKPAEFIVFKISQKAPGNDEDGAQEESSEE